MNCTCKYIIIILLFNINNNIIISLKLINKLLYSYKNQNKYKLTSLNDNIEEELSPNDMKALLISSLEKEQEQVTLSYEILNNFPVKLNINELKSNWVNNNPYTTITQPNLNDLIDYISNSYKNKYIELVDDVNSESVDLIYISESELIRLWNEPTNQQFGKSFQDFDIKNALLLVDDDDTEVFTKSDEILSTNILLSTNNKSITTLPSNQLTNDNNAIIEEEYFISDTELKKLWNEKSKIRMSLPSTNYDTISALLLLCDDYESDFEYGTEYSKNGFVLASSLADQNNNPLKVFWEKISDPELRESVKRMVEDIDDVGTSRKAWKKGKNVLTADIDTQDYMGDIMFGNTYLTTRIPTNWNDPEANEMSEIYRSTGSMEWPGEEPTDYTIDRPIYEILDLPFGPKYEIKQHTKSNENHNPTIDKPETINWESFDFSTIDNSNKNLEINSDDLEIDNFFKNLGSNGLSIIQTNNTITKPFDMNEIEPDEPEGEIELIPGKTPPIIIEKSTCKDWVTPREWIERNEFKDHVPYDKWSNYRSVDDDVWTDDIYAMKTIQHINATTNLYLFNHLNINDINENYKYIEKVVHNQLLLDNSSTIDINDTFPKYLTPDIDKGIEYTNVVLEMKGKLSLEPKQLDPKVEYVNDTFIYNEDKAPMNIIGTIREQYDWTPTPLEQQKHWIIEDHVLDKIQPVLKYVNYLAELKSTRDNVLIFEYRGIIRHIVGLRESIKAYAKEVYPELVDLRLETPYKNDKYDI